MTEPDLARLVLDSKGDRSYERMSADCGGIPTDKRLQQMATTPLKAFPDIATIQGLARGTGSTETAVVLAAARSLGLRVHSGEDPDALIIGGGGNLRPDQKDTIRALARVFQEMNRDAAAHHVIALGRMNLESIRDVSRRMPGQREGFHAAALRDRGRFETSLEEAGALPAEVREQAAALMIEWDRLIDELAETPHSPISNLAVAGRDEHEGLEEAAYHSPEPAGLPQPEEP